MNNSLILDEKILRRIPPVFVLFLIIILGLPALALNYISTDYSSIAKSMGYEGGIGASLIEAQIRSYFSQTLLQWSAFSLSAITVLFSFTQYRLTRDKIALLIGLSVLFSGTVEALQTLINNSTTSIFFDTHKLNAVIWTVTNTVSGLIFMIGLILILKYENKPTLRVSTSIWLGILVFICAVALIYYATFHMKLPEMWFKYLFIARPYEAIYLIIYLVIILALYPRVYKLHPYILTNCIFYMSVTEIVSAVYLMVLSNAPFDSAYNIAYFLKIVVYFIPFSCLIINYVFSYNAILEAQWILKESERKLKYMAAHDALTELYNRREFEDLLDKTIANAGRDDASFALFVIDIDNFKSINDTLGHIHGDAFLKLFSSQLGLLTRKGDVVSRIGGDEFTIITARLNSPTSARKVAERIVKGMNISYPVGGKLLVSTVSIGIAIYPQDGTGTEALLKNADIAMYSSKKSGKNTYRFYTENLSTLQHRSAEIESHLRTALKRDEFRLFYQPKYNLVTKDIVGAEILLRWHNPNLGDISPEEFIPVAEATGLLAPIGNWVLNKACEQAQIWSKQYERNIIFSINISTIQFEHHEFATQLQKTLEKYEYPPNCLNLEITEDLLLKNSIGLSERMQQLKKLGVQLTIDDFGMGYSSLSRLKNMPISTLKIDKSFIAEIQHPNDKVIVIDTIIKLAQELDMNIVAEGIETKAQLTYLVAKECLYGQGYYLCKPMNQEDFEKLTYQKPATS